MISKQEFLSVHSQFRLGELETEQPHPHTVGLAELARSDLPAAVRMLHAVDLLAMDRLVGQLDPIEALVADIRECLSGDGRVFLVGCGATGRLSLAIEAILRASPGIEDVGKRIVGIMAGGDAALIRSIESFEDCPPFAERQLADLEFSPDDLLIAITEGGETPFVIGACLYAERHSRQAPWFLFCNPPEVLCRLLQRCRDVLEHPRIRAFCLAVGPMALSGSTRLQATTVQMLVTGAAILEAARPELAAIELIKRFHLQLQAHQPEALVPLIRAEVETYRQGGRVLYRTSRYGISVLTDTTERSPTFSLAPFENFDHPEQPCCWCYLTVPDAADSKMAWRKLLGRNPRTLEWPEFIGRTGWNNLRGCDISALAEKKRIQHGTKGQQLVIDVEGDGPCLRVGDLNIDLQAASLHPLLQHLILKVSLNLHSTLVMACMERFESNLMTRVYPGNFKLIDRAARYLKNEYKQRKGKELDYYSAVDKVFEQLTANR